MPNVLFELIIPNVGSWNGHWSGEKNKHLLFKTLPSEVAKQLDGESWFYTWDDGWTAGIKARTMHDGAETRRLKALNKGFCGYDWMVKSIIACGEIRKPT